MKLWSTLTLFCTVTLVFNLFSLRAQPSAPRFEAPPVLAVLETNRSDRPPSLLLLDALRKNNSVIPPRPNVHPVATVYNREAIVPPQCYTKTTAFYNPCYTCHQDAKPRRENVMNDADLQEAYSFSDLGMTNHWKNLFEDRSRRVANISDDAILEYVSGNNYSELPARLKEAGFQGWVPDLANLQLAADAFDDEGFAKDGSHWIAYSYKPFPSTFWPTNGSTDDVMIRLPEHFRTARDGRYSRDTYKANLAIVEAKIKGVSEIGCLALDERKIGRDLDGDGSLTTISRITAVDSYVGAAEHVFADSHLYPQGVEFAHTVRYLGITPDGEIGPSARMKEVRYMKKWREFSKPVYARQYQLESFEKEAGNLPGYQNLGDWGLDNGNGWSIQGFIEDSQGRLRVNTYEETLFCMGCHNSIGSTIDKTFSLARKVDGAAGWGYINLKGMPDAPTQGETRGEIATYLERVGGGSEFRHNDEMFGRWFMADGTVDHDKVAAARDVYELIAPSRERALALNKAYKTIVEDQSFIFGRDAMVTPPGNVYERIDNESTPTLPVDRIFKWNIILDWSQSAH
jgi:hypothetical protein